MELRAREGVDRVLLVCVGLLVVIALLLLESALRGVASGATLSAHLIRLGLALGVGVVAYRMDHRQLIRLSPALFLVALGLSAIAITSGALRAGTRRWLEVGTLTLQPGELAKISLVLLLAHLIARSRHEPLSRRATVGLDRGVRRPRAGGGGAARPRERGHPVSASGSGWCSSAA